jgi:hypothetical protein
MTEFRSKGKGNERKVYPVGKKQPFGITKDLAYKDVAALRERGKKARLIETNRRLSLYAPYKGVILSTLPAQITSQEIKPDSTSPINAPNPYEDKVAAKKERYKQLADKKKAESESRFEQAHRMSSAIPLGQPILVGHYSEKSDRNYRDRIEQNYKKAIELDNQADYYSKKAQTVGTGGISQDDPEAITKLQKKIQELENENGIMKYHNSLMRKGHETEAMNILNNDLKSELDKYTKFSNSKGLFPTFVLSNNTSKIRQAKERINSLQKRATQEYNVVKKTGYSVIEDPDMNRLQIKFDGIPAESVRNALKSNGFRWSPTNGVWQSYLNNRSKYALTRFEDEMTKRSE